jgi:Skp family chaperone for outer membrane proteins
MKKFLLMIMFVLICGVCMAEQKIAVVDMNKLLRSHPETQQAEAVLEEQIEEMETEKERLMEKLGKMRDEVEDAMKQAQNRVLSEKKRDQLKEEAERKYKELRKMDIEAKKEMDGRKKDLAEQKLMMHKRIVGEIAETVKEYADKKGYDFVLDSGGIGVSGMPAVIHSAESADITDQIEKLIEKKKD